LTDPHAILCKGRATQPTPTRASSRHTFDLPLCASLEAFAGEKQERDESEELCAPPQRPERSQGCAWLLTLRLSAEAHETIHLAHTVGYN